MNGDYGVIHIEVSHDLTPEEASRLFHEVCELTDKRRWRKKDIGVTAHWDGDCEESPHCFGAFLRNRAGRVSQPLTEVRPMFDTGGGEQE